MARPARWREGKLTQGFFECRLSSWKYFSDYISQELLDYTTYIFRGHGDSNWKLEPTIDRVIKSPTSRMREKHFNTFKYAARGRRGKNPPTIRDDNYWWSLGRHHGLLTPLLDWTESPFVALYFAAYSSKKNKTENYSVFALSQLSIRLNNKKISEDDKIENVNNRKPTVKIVRPLSDENNRLVSQRGLFTRGPNNMDLETWVKKFNHRSNKQELLKITIPSKDIDDCLRFLNRMNISHSTLFPDLSGASEFCNMHLEIAKY